MIPNRQVSDYLSDIILAEKAIEFTAQIPLAEFTVDEKTTYAVIRALEILGEATKRIPQAVRDKHPQIPWRLMAGIRDKLIHDYVNVNVEVVWRTVNEDLPNVLPELKLTLEAERLSGS
jgi:uncharacterized protein with HEPN domain